MTMLRARAGLTRDQLWIALVVFLPALASLLAPMSTVDLAYQVRAGQLMIADGAVLRTDPFTFTVGGEPWLNQQWGAQVLFGALYDVAGWSGLAVIRAAVISALLGLVYLAGRWRGGSVRVAAVLALAGFVVAMAGMGLRPQLLGMLCFAATSAIAAGCTRWPRALWLVPAITVMWANLHGSFVLAPALAGVVALDDLVSRRPVLRRDVSVLALTLAATVITPFGAGAWSYALSLSLDPQVRLLVTEWQPLSPLSVVGAIYLGSVLAAAVLIALRPRSIAWPWLAWLAALAVLGIAVERGIVWWAIGAPPLVVVAVMALPERAPSSRPVQASRPASPVNGLLALALAAAVVLLLPGWRGDDPLYGPPGLLADAPRGVTDAVLTRASAEDRLFTAQHWGSWFEFAVPEVPLYVDSRIELFPPGVWTDYQAISHAEGGWADVLEQWDVSVLAISQEGQAGLLEALGSDLRWEAVFSDDDGAVYVRAAAPASG